MANSEEEVIEALGALASPVDVRDYTISIPKDFKFPNKFELNMVRVKNQGFVGSCVAHAISEVIEYHNSRQEQNDKEMSPGFIYGNRADMEYKKSGMIMRQALSKARKDGEVYYEDFPYNKEVPEMSEMVAQQFDKLKDRAYPNRISAYLRVSTDEEIKYALMTYGPLIFSVTWYKGIKVNSDGIMEWTQGTKKSQGGHCMVIYGWDERGWKIQNSWGIIWGKGGTAILPYDAKKNEVWAIVDEISGETEKDIIKPFNTTFMQKVAIVLNKLLNLFRSSAKSSRV